MLCSIAGMCSDGCELPVKLADGTQAKRRFDKCTDNGLSTGQPVPAHVASGNGCTSDADCNKQNPAAWCSLSSATAQQVRAMLFHLVQFA
jgi:hypothetical protein